MGIIYSKQNPIWHSLNEMSSAYALHKLFHLSAINYGVDPVHRMYYVFVVVTNNKATIN